MKCELMGGRLHLYKRPQSRFWQCYTFLGGRPWRESTKQESLTLAKEFAEDWYLTLKGKDRVGELKSGKTFKFVAQQFMEEYRLLTQGERSPQWIEYLEMALNKYLIPYFGPLAVTEITAGKAQEYRMHRLQNGYRGQPPSRKTLENEMIALRQVLKTAVRHR